MPSGSTAAKARLQASTAMWIWISAIRIFPTVIKNKGLNGFGKEKDLPDPPVTTADDGIAVEVTVDGQKYSGKLNKA